MFSYTGMASKVNSQKRYITFWLRVAFALTKGASILCNQSFVSFLIFFYLEMAFFLDSDLPSIQSPGYQNHHAKHCRMCCTTAVCEDIWKKFALEDVEASYTPPVYPTPPLSPEPLSDSEGEERCCLEQITRALFEEFCEDDEDDERDDGQQLEEMETCHQNLLRSMLIQVRVSAILFIQETRNV